MAVVTGNVPERKIYRRKVSFRYLRYSACWGFEVAVVSWWHRLLYVIVICRIAK
jgi:hypothetical protein